MYLACRFHVSRLPVLEDVSVSKLFRFLRRILPAVLALTLSHASFSQVVARPLPMHAPVQDKNFYLLSLLQQNSQIRAALTSDPALTPVAAERARFVEFSLHTCKQDPVCTLKAFLWTDEEIRNVSFALAHIYADNPSMQHLVDGDLRSSGAYILYQEQGGAALLVNAWEICARGLNDVISVYGLGLPPRYPLIDSISFDVKSSDYQQQITPLVSQIFAGTSPSQLFFDPTLSTALQLLTMNHRDEAGRLEPMEASVNAVAVQAMAKTAWGKFPYSVIVVPGAGPGDLHTALSPAGRSRAALAAEAYHAGKAPFILLSGGFVHPSQTTFSEAVEMKKALLQDYSVPEAALLVDPHARHTTTNMRNAAREIYRYGMPFNKPALVVSDAAQIGYIASQSLADRCLRELGYVPYQVLEQPSATSLVFLPKADSLEQDPIEPLDP
jgi:hypothetical protein